MTKKKSAQILCRPQYSSNLSTLAKMHRSYGRMTEGNMKNTTSFCTKPQFPKQYVTKFEIFETKLVNNLFESKK